MSSVIVGYERCVWWILQGSVGLPVGIQVAAPPYHEETVLRILQDIEKSIEREKTLVNKE